jgi:TP901 family phage tail tape measure protein
MKEAAEFAESTQILMNVSEFTDVSQATDTLISAVQAFGYTAETSMDVVDLLNTIGNNYAISTADLAKSLTKSSASLVAAGGNLAEAAALTATANAIIQDADSVGTALKTTSLRLRGTSVKVLEEEGLDTDGAVESTSKLRSQVLATSGVDILTDTGAYKSTYQILLEIAEVWDQITDDKARAGLLELLAGKRNSSVIAALLQNPEDLKAAYEDAMDAEGSALKENERYLDSIQGKIDQFNNAMQAMWSDTLDSDVVKWFVGLGTELIKIVDTIGLIPSILAAILTYKLAIGAAKLFHLGDLMTYIGLMWTAKDVTELQGWALDQINIKQALMNSTLIKAQAARMGLTAADLAGYSVTQLLTLGVKGLAAGFKNLWIAMGPVGWAILAIVAAATIFTVIFNTVNKTTEELTEELNDLKAELQDIQSEMETVNSELETMEERMAELLAKDSLSFVEQEELDRLQKENNELQRRLDLLEEEEKIKQNQAADTFVKTMESYGDKTYGREGEMGWFDKLLDFFGDDAYAESQEAYIDKLMGEYDKVLKVDNGELDRSVLVDEMSVDWYSERIGEEVQALVDAADGIEYFVGDSLTKQQKEVNEWLDYVYNTQDKLAVMRNGKDAKTNTINRIFDKDEYSEVSDSIGAYVEALKNGDASAKAKIDSIIKGNQSLVDDLRASGIQIGNELNEAADYFTSFASDANYSTIEGKTKEIEVATSGLTKILSGAFSKDLIGPLTKEQLEFANLFNENGKVLSDSLAKYFQGTSDTTRKEISRLVKNIHDGEMTVEQAMKSFAAYGMLESWKIIETEVSELNTNVFKDLGDEISGVINTVKELSAAFEDVSKSIDLVSQAEAEMAYSGHLSIETALQLMESTDDWNSVLEIENGNIKLLNRAEDALIQTKLDLIKTNLQTALSTVEAQLAQLDATTSSADMAYTIEESTNLAVTQLAGNMAYLTEMMTAYTKAAAGENVDMSAVTAAAEAAKKKVLDDTNYQKNTAERIGREDLEKERDRLKAMIGIVETGDTRAEFEDNYSSDKVSGGNDTKEDAIASWYEKQQALLDNQQKHIQNQIDILEAKGQTVSKSYYEEQIALEEKKLGLYEQELGALQKLSYTDDNVERMWELERAIQESVLRMIEFRESIVALYEAAFDDVGTAYGNREDFKQDQQDYISKYAELNEDSAGIAIKAQIDIEEDKLKDSQDKVQALMDAFSLASSDGYTDEDGNFVPYLEEGSEQWVKMQDEIREAEAAVLDNQLAIKNYKEELADLASDRFSKLATAFDRHDDILSDRQSFIENRMESESTTDSQKKSGYRELINIEQEKKSVNREELEQLIALRDEYLKDGTIEFGSEQWFEMEEQIRATEAAIQDSDLAIEKYNESLKQLYVEAFTKIVDAFGDIEDLFGDRKSYIEQSMDFSDTTDSDKKTGYRALIANERQSLQANKAELDSLRKAQASMEVGSEEWIEQESQIRATEAAILDNKLALDKYNESLKQLYVDAFNKIIDAFDKLESLFGDRRNYIEKSMDLDGTTDSQKASGYRALIGVEEKSLKENTRQLAILEKAQSDALANGAMEIGDDEWIKSEEQIRATETAILDSKLAVEKYNEQLKQLHVEAFNKVADAFGQQDDLFSDQQNYVEKTRELMELNGEAPGAYGYQQLIGAERGKLVDNQKELVSLISLRDEYVKNGKIEEGGEEWLEMSDKIREAEAAVLDSKIALAQYNEQLKQLHVDAFNNIDEAFSDIGDLYGDRQSYIEKYMEYAELQGKDVSKAGYEALIGIEEDKIDSNTDRLAELVAERDRALESGTLNRVSDEWVEMESKIRAAEAAVLDGKIAIEQYNQELKNIQADAFNKIRDAFSFKDDIFNTQQTYVEGYISHLEELGIGVPDEAYEKLISIEQAKRDNNLADLIDARQGLVDMEAKGFDASSEEWQSAYKSITDLEKKIQDSDIATAQWEKTLRDMDFSRFESFLGRLDDINSELENLHGLTSKEDAATEDGSWTDDGLTSLGLLYQQMELNQKKSQEYAQKIDDLSRAYANGEMSESEYYERLQQLKDGQWDAINAYESSKDVMVDMEEARIDMIEEGINKEIEAYQELIDLKRDELDAERDLYEFKKDIQKQTKDIASLERRIASLSGSSAASDIAERRKLEAELREAQDGLSDTYYSHSKDQQGQALDNEMESFQKAKEDYVEALRETLDDTAAIINGLISTVLVNSETVLAGIESTAGEHGVTLSGALTGPWQNASSGVSSFKDTVSSTISDIQKTIEESVAPLTGALGLPWNDLTKEDGPINTFSETVGDAIDGVIADAKELSDSIGGQINTDGADNTFSEDVEQDLIDSAGDEVENAENLQSSLAQPFIDAANAAETFGNKAATAIDNAVTKATENALTLAQNVKDPYDQGDYATHIFSEGAEGAILRAAEAATNNYDDLVNKITGPFVAGKDAANTFGHVSTNAIVAAAKAATDNHQSLVDNISNPFIKGKEAANTFKSDAITAITGVETDAFYSAINMTGNLTSPWNNGLDAANTFSTNTGKILNDWARKAEAAAARVKEATTVTYSDYTGNGGGGNGGGGYSGNYDNKPTAAEIRKNARNAAQAYVDKMGFSEGDKARWGQDKNFLPLLQALIKAGGSINDLEGITKAEYREMARKAAQDYVNKRGFSEGDKARWGQDPEFRKLLQTLIYHGGSIEDLVGKRYAKGTTGTTKDQWALTDEPQFGDELVLIPGKDGNLSFMRKGTGVVPADLTANLMEWGQFTPDSMNLGGGVNVNMINNAVNKPEFNFNFDALVKAERIDENTLPEVKKFVQQEINSLVKQMNYAIKGKGGR